MGFWDSIGSWFGGGDGGGGGGGFNWSQWGPLIGAGAGALANYGSAKNLNKPRYTSQTTTQSPWGPSQPFLNIGLDQALANLYRPSTPMPGFHVGSGGGGVEGLIGRLANFRAGVPTGQIVGSTTEDLEAGRGYMDTGAAWLEKLLADTSGTNELLQSDIDVLQREADETYQQSIVPQTRSRFAAGGALSSGLAENALVRSGEEYNEAVQGSINQLMNAFRDAQLQGTGVLGQYAGVRGNYAQILSQAAAAAAQIQAQARATKASALAAALSGASSLAGRNQAASMANQQQAYQRWLYGEQLPAQRLNEYLSGVLPIAGLGGTTTQTGTQGGAGVNPFWAALQGGLGGYFGGQQLFGPQQQGQPQGSQVQGQPYGFQQYGNPYDLYGFSRPFSQIG